jgi:hypothetical protein
MSQATKSVTTNRIHFASAGAVRRRPAPATATLVLPAGLAAALEELCMLAAYHPDGFTYTPQMEAACQHIADKSSPAVIDACLARASVRERAYVTASRAA